MHCFLFIFFVLFLNLIFLFNLNPLNKLTRVRLEKKKLHINKKMCIM